jgi:hypothetical protein
MDSARRKRGPAPVQVVTAVFIGGAALLVALLAFGYGYDAVHRHMARPGVLGSWPAARRLVARRLQPDEPLEFGAVWATHAGMICGLVNGWDSFGGLTGMTSFVVEDGRAIFAQDVGPLAFAPDWRRCMTDRWITILDGSMQTGWCATRLGQTHCVTRTG